MPKRVLMLCYYYPPIDAIGALRSVAFALNFREFGWEPVVLSVTQCKDRWVTVGNSRPPEGVAVFRAPEFGIGRYCDYLQGAFCRLLRLFGFETRRNWVRDIFCFPDAQITWLPAIKGISLAPAVDVIYVSCSPFSAALNGVLIKEVTGLPLVLDFRDPWNVPVSGSRYRGKMLELLERFVLRRADMIILNTPGAERIYRSAFPDLADRFLCIPNGYDRLIVAPTAPNENTFRIVHTGNFYLGRSPELLLRALHELGRDDIEFVQVGNMHEGITRFKGKVRITCTGVLPREEAIDWMQKASLLFLNQGPEFPHAIAAKTYEYLASGRPILVDAPPGENAEFITRYAARSYVVTSGSHDDLRQAVLKAYEERSLPCGVKQEFVSSFQRRELTGRLAARMSQLISMRSDA
ncbi:MAG: glycosyltransferase family 4 protein [Blastocatellia bacterium]|nr:glycosyltransferase family 4 protein [Blastocatellia bacterium]